jgi:hypothetical protein
VDLGDNVHEASSLIKRFYDDLPNKLFGSLPDETLDACGNGNAIMRKENIAQEQKRRREYDISRREKKRDERRCDDDVIMTHRYVCFQLKWRWVFGGDSRWSNGICSRGCWSFSPTSRSRAIRTRWTQITWVSFSSLLLASLFFAFRFSDVLFSLLFLFFVPLSLSPLSSHLLASLFDWTSLSPWPTYSSSFLSSLILSPLLSFLHLLSLYFSFLIPLLLGIVFGPLLALSRNPIHALMQTAKVVQILTANIAHPPVGDEPLGEEARDDDVINRHTYPLLLSLQEITDERQLEAMLSPDQLAQLAEW